MSCPFAGDQIRRLPDFELEPEVRDRVDSLSDSDSKRVDDVCGMLAERDAELGGPWSDQLERPAWDPRTRDHRPPVADVCERPVR